jgi:hypothetical protein
MRTGWLLRQDVLLATVDVADTFMSRSRGLLGRDSFEGALLLTHTRSVHSLFMRFGVDVAFLDRNLVVLDTLTLPPWRVALPRARGRSVLEAERGAFERWGLRPGDQLELRETQ